MKILPLLLAVSFVSLSSCSSKPDAGTVRSEVRAVLDAQQKAWNEGSLAGYMEGYLRSDTTRFIAGGTTTTGWKTVFSRMKKSYPDQTAMGALRFFDVDIIPLADDAAFVTGKWMLTHDRDRVWGAYTLLFLKAEDGWKIVVDHTDSAKK